MLCCAAILFNDIDVSRSNNCHLFGSGGRGGATAPPFLRCGYAHSNVHLLYRFNVMNLQHKGFIFEAQLGFPDDLAILQLTNAANLRKRHIGIIKRYRVVHCYCY